jgi:Flp pilus assembly protein TadD
MTHTVMGIALAKEGRFNDAVNHYYKLLQLNPGDTEAERNLELSLADLKKSA